MITPAFANGGIRAGMHLKRNRGYLILFESFEWKIWATVVLLWLLYGICLAVISRLSKKGAKTDDFSLTESLWYFSYIPLQFGADKHPVSLAGQFLQGGWGFFSLVFIASFTANLAAIFSYESYSPPLKVIEDIRESHNVSAFRIYERDFRALKNPILERLFESGQLNLMETKREKPSFFNSFSDTIKDIEKRLKDGHVWIDFDSYLHWLMESDSKIYLLDGYFSRRAYGFAMRKDWKFANDVRKLITKYSDSGYIDVIIRKYAKKKESTETGKPQPIPLESIFSLVFIVIACAIVAMIIAAGDFVRGCRGMVGDTPIETVMISVR